jgi:xanthine dehydrogenase molybdenum-binding subunit
MTYKVIGTRPVRPDGADKVTGRAAYGADIHLPGLLHGKVLRSPHAHARITAIDTSAAKAMPGVYAVMTEVDMGKLDHDGIADLGESQIQLSFLRDLTLAGKKVLFHGHPIAAVAANSIHVAEEACKAIKVTYEVLTPVMTVEQAMAPGAPLLHEQMRTVTLGKKTDTPSNIAKHSQLAHGSVAEGFAEADLVVERTFTTAMVHQGYIEPQTATAQVGFDGSVTVWTSTQGAFGVRSQVAELLNLPLGKIKVIPTEIGGGFGGKLRVYLEPLAVVLSRMTGRPVKLTMSREEVFQATGPTSGSTITVKIGAKRDGTITAIQGNLAYEAGAYPGSPVGAGMGVIFAPYKTKNLLIDGYDVLVNRPNTSAYRAPGGTNAAFAAEQVIDELAEKLGLDPIAFRLTNAVREGENANHGPKFGNIGLVQLLETVAASDHYNTPLTTGANVGRGIAIGFWFNGGGPSSSHITFNHDGTVTLNEGSTDIGGSRASMAMIVAEELGIPYVDVKPVVADTDSVGFTAETGGSRTTYATGLACHTAAQEAKKQLCERAAITWEIPVDQVTYVPGTGVVATADATKVLTVAEIAKEMNKTGGPIYAVGAVNAKGAAPAFAAHIADVAVDPETGKVTILRYTAFQDVGRAIHPAYVEGQIQGGSVQGIGWALNEEYVYDAEGHLRNGNLLDYRVPTALDLPMIDTVLVEVPNPAHPYGVRGVGEVCIVPPAGALANAIYRAVGIRFETLPMNPERVCMAILQAGAR